MPNRDEAECFRAGLFWRQVLDSMLAVPEGSVADMLIRHQRSRAICLRLLPCHVAADVRKVCSKSGGHSNEEGKEAGKLAVHTLPLTKGISATRQIIASDRYRFSLPGKIILSGSEKITGYISVAFRAAHGSPQYCALRTVHPLHYIDLLTSCSSDANASIMLSNAGGSPKIIAPIFR